MEIVDLLKLLGGIGGVLGLIVVGLFGVSKFRSSKLVSTFQKLATGVDADKEKVQGIDVAIGKGEQKKEDLQVEVDKVDKELEKVEQEPSKVPTNDSIINMFDRLSKK